MGGVLDEVVFDLICVAITLLLVNLSISANCAQSGAN